MKIRHLRWYIAALLFFASVINYIDRQTLSIVAPVLTKELHISPIQYSNILQAFLIAYTVMYLGSGFLVDRWGTRISLAAFMAWWSISNMLHAFANSAFQMGAFRFLLGVGEPGNFMAALKATSEWYPAKEKAFVNGLVNAGASVGAIISAPARGLADAAVRVAVVLRHHRSDGVRVAGGLAVPVSNARKSIRC